MTIQSSGAISISDLRGEFGGSTPDSISEYYRGGGLVPDTSMNSSIPTSGAISLSDFYGTSNVTVKITAQTVSATNNMSGSCAAGIRVLRNGKFQSDTNNNGTTLSYSDVAADQWADPESSTVGDDFEVRYDTSGSPLGDSVNTWLALSSNREWRLEGFFSGSQDASGTLSIRPVGGATEDQASITLSTEVT